MDPDHQAFKTNRDNLGLWDSCIYLQLVVFSSGHSYAHEVTESLQTSDAVRHGKGSFNELISHSCLAPE